MQNLFNSIRVKTPPYSTFDLSHDVKISGKIGPLIPVWTKEMLPGDRFSGTAQCILRMPPLIAPVMHKMEIFFHAFFVPYRLLWPGAQGWENFITGGNKGDVPPALPVFNNYSLHPLGLTNYLTACQEPEDPAWNSGLNPQITCFRHAAYQRIWYDWFRDQNLQEMDEPLDLIAGDNNVNQPWLEVMRYRAFEHDYFTSCLPWAQKGEAVGVPLELSNATILARQPGSTPENPFNPRWLNSASGTPIVNVPSASVSQYFQSTNELGSTVAIKDVDGVHTPDYYDPQGSLYMSGDGSITINNLRASWALQRWLEKNARGGTRYAEALRVHFGVICSDARLNRAEYLGGSKSVMAFSEVLQTSSTDTTSPQGNMAGHAISVSGGGLFSYRAEEHGQIMVLMSVRPKTGYYQGMPRELLKKDRFDFYFQEFAALGEQEVWNQELFLSSPADSVFGYLPRYAEYRTEPSRVVGTMATTLEFWHDARKFDYNFPPALNELFIRADSGRRYTAVNDPEVEDFMGHIIFKIMARRPLPAYGTPL